MDPLSISALLGIGSKLIDKFFPDPAKADAAKLELLKMQQSGELAQLAADTDLAKAQLAVNQAEAGNASLFVAGWRPWIGWVCGFALAYVAVFEPVGRFVAQVWFHYAGPFPAIDTTITLQVLLGMLGLGAMRSVEKVKRVA